MATIHLDPVLIQSRMDLVTNRIGDGPGRSLQALLDSDDPLSDEEAQRLRNYATQNGISIGQLDAYGRMLAYGNLGAVQLDFVQRVARHLTTTDSTDVAKTAAAEEIAKLRWGPTKVPIFDLMLSALILMPFGRDEKLAVTRWLANEAKVPVNGKDVTGTTAMFHAISTQPVLDLEFAQILYDAGGEVSDRNRYGCNAAHEMCMVYDGRTMSGVQRTRDAMRWFLSHGGNLDIADNEGATARKTFMASYNMWKSGRNSPIETVYKVIKEDDRRRKQLGHRCCALCGREPDARTQLLECPKCTKIKYCSSPRDCQDLDWPKHKKTCMSAADLALDEVRRHMYLGVPNIL